ncbi:MULTISPECIES: hypothetical protein [unclassified Blastococcus]
MAGAGAPRHHGIDHVEPAVTDLDRPWLPSPRTAGRRFPSSEPDGTEHGVRAER